MNPQRKGLSGASLHRKFAHPIPADVLAFTKAAFLKKTVKGDEGHPTVCRRPRREYMRPQSKALESPSHQALWWRAPRKTTPAGPQFRAAKSA